MLLTFQVCFFVGIGLSVLSFILGQIGDLTGLAGLDFNLEFFGADFFLPVTPSLCMIFLTVFGGAGWLLYKTPGFGLPVILLLAIAAGILIVFIFYRYFLLPLKKAQNTSAPEQEELIGLPAAVIEKIKENGFGEITYTIHGNSYTAPAKSTDGTEVPIGMKVGICWIEDHVFYVVPLYLL